MWAQNAVHESLQTVVCMKANNNKKKHATKKHKHQQMDMLLLFDPASWYLCPISQAVSAYENYLQFFSIIKNSIHSLMNSSTKRLECNGSISITMLNEESPKIWFIGKAWIHFWKQIVNTYFIKTSWHLCNIWQWRPGSMHINPHWWEVL